MSTIATEIEGDVPMELYRTHKYIKNANLCLQCSGSGGIINKLSHGETHRIEEKNEAAQLKSKKCLTNKTLTDIINELLRTK